MHPEIGERERRSQEDGKTGSREWLKTSSLHFPFPSPCSILSGEGIPDAV
jgi:hypothetical protein